MSNLQPKWYVHTDQKNKRAEKNKVFQAVKLTWQKPRSERVHKLFKEVKKFSMQEQRRNVSGHRNKKESDNERLPKSY